jgi:hypothetical protein
MICWNCYPSLSLVISVLMTERSQFSRPQVEPVGGMFDIISSVIDTIDAKRIENWTISSMGLMVSRKECKIDILCRSKQYSHMSSVRERVKKWLSDANIDPVDVDALLVPYTFVDMPTNSSDSSWLNQVSVAIRSWSSWFG